jgi:hypothetical protein
VFDAAASGPHEARRLNTTPRRVRPAGQPEIVVVVPPAFCPSHLAGATGADCGEVEAVPGGAASEVVGRARGLLTPGCPYPDVS